ncbi:uncharacterized protein A4U43_C07F19750 [Asparagus officinalis]|uniref:Uncharacterized protein n=1 Tax=Asparagus officinalis TaxID=4686 RepID=A0A5P1EF73_ASPOF|nr:uncharacterized protein LOC109850081 [Asparagus officinalis]ONK63867.1 uncharacterized protein A4U43_C07F19750 [Asparagus officinalis]
MASSAITGSLLKFLNGGAAMARRSCPANLRALVTGAPGGPGSMEGGDPQMMKESSGPMESSPTEPRGMASSAAARREVSDEMLDEADDMTNKVKEKASNMSEKAENISEKAKQTVQEVWGSAKETAQKVKETVVGKAEDAKEFIHDKAEAADRAVKSGIAEARADAEAGRSTVKGEAFQQAAKNPETVKNAMNTKDS